MNATETIRNYSQLEARQNSVIDYLGLQVSYNLEGVQIEKSALQSLLAATPFGNFQPRAISPLVRGKRAVNEMLQEQANRYGGTRLQHGGSSSGDDLDGDGKSDVYKLEDQTPKTGDWHIIHVVKKTNDWQQLGLEFATDERIFINKTNGTIWCTADASGQMSPGAEDRFFARKLQPYWAKWENTCAARDVSVLLKSIIDHLFAFPVRRNGGVYFIATKRYDENGNLLPDTITPQVYALRDLVLKLPYSGYKQPTMRVMRIVDAAEEENEAQGAAYDELMDELNRQSAEMDELVAKDTFYSGTIAARLMEYQEIKQRGSIYAQALHLQTRELEEKIASLEGRALAALASMTTRPKKERKSRKP